MPVNPLAVAGIGAAGNFLSSMFGGGQQAGMQKNQLKFAREGLAQDDRHFWAQYGQGARNDAFGAQERILGARGMMDEQSHARAGSNATLGMRRNLINALAAKFGGGAIDFGGMAPTQVTQTVDPLIAAGERFNAPAEAPVPAEREVFARRPGESQHDYIMRRQAHLQAAQR
jgi:hypothetical protein